MLGGLWAGALRRHFAQLRTRKKAFAANANAFSKT